MPTYVDRPLRYFHNVLFHCFHSMKLFLKKTLYFFFGSHRRCWWKLSSGDPNPSVHGQQPLISVLMKRRLFRVTLCITAYFSDISSVPLLYCFFVQRAGGVVTWCFIMWFFFLVDHVWQPNLARPVCSSPSGGVPKKCSSADQDILLDD